MALSAQRAKLRAHQRAVALQESAELRAWASTAFRPAKLHGSPAAMRAAAKYGEPVSVGDLAIAGGVLLGSFFVGRWLGRHVIRHGQHYQRGADLQAAG